MGEQLTPKQQIEVVRADRRRRWLNGDRIPSEEYLRRNPVLREDLDHAVEVVYHEVLLREELGEHFQWEEYFQRFPRLSVRLKPLFEVHQAFGAVDDPSTLEPSRPPVGATAPAFVPSIPGYEILGQLGRGAMGVVYQARHERLNRVVALKMINSGPFAEEVELARFRAEAQAQARLQHPNIVQIFEVGEVDDEPYFALEYVDGGHLGRYLAGKPRPARPAAQMLETLARAIHHAHQRGLVHRDLKPSNVLLTAEGAPKITDFGLAKRLEGDAGLSRSGMVIGTPSYMSPEQAEGKTRLIGPATDVYSLGAILYEMLTARPPFLAETSLETIVQVIYENPVPPRLFQPKVARDLETICLKCLNKEPGKRYPSAAALAEDLRRFVAGEPIQARPVNGIERLWRWSRRNPALAAASVLATAGLIAAVVVSVLFAAHQAATATHLAAIARDLRAEKRQTEDALAQAEEQRRLADRANDNLREEKRATEKHLGEIRRLSTIRAIDQGLLLCEQGDVPRGMLWLARSLQEVPDEAADLQRVIRANLAGWRRHLYPLRWCLKHEGGVWAVAFSPDGETLLSAGANRTAYLWNAATGAPRNRLLPPHQKPIWAVAFSPDGKLVVTGSQDGTARLWDAASREVVGTLNHDGAVQAAVFSPDSKTLATGCGDGQARLWNVETRTLLVSPLNHKNGKRANAVHAVAFSPDGRKLLTGCEDRTVQLWEVATGKRLGPPLRHSHAVWTVAFCSEGQTLLAGGTDGRVLLWDADTRKPLGIHFKYRGVITAGALNPKGDVLVTGGAEGTCCLWDVATGELRGSVFHHGGRVRATAFSPDLENRFVVTGSSDKTVRLWDAFQGESFLKRWDLGAGVRAVGFSPDGQMLLTGAGTGRVRLWKGDGTPTRHIFRHDKPILAAVFSPDGTKVLSGGRDNSARLWDVATGQAVCPPLGHDDIVKAVAFRFDGQRFLTGCFDGSVRQWDANTGKTLDHLTIKSKLILHAAVYSPDGETILAGYGDNTARLWNATNGQAVGVLPHEAVVLAVAFTPDGHFILTGTEAGMVQRWDAATKKPLGSPLAHAGPIRGLAFSPDGRLLLTDSADGTARLWDAATGKPLGPPFAHSSLVQSVAFAPDGKTILTGGDDRNACLWKVPVPVEEKADQVLRWVNVLTGMDLDADGGVHYLDPATWRQFRQRIKGGDGPPLP